MDDKSWLEKVRALPFLMKLADAFGGDRYEKMATLKADHEARGDAYVWTTLYRHPPAPCASGEHSIESSTHEIVKPGIPGKHGRLMISERVLHDIEHHGRRFQPDQVRKLEAIFHSPK